MKEFNNKKKIAAIVPALNEEANVGNVLKSLLESKEFDEVILVNDGSTDRTAEIGRGLGVKVINLLKRGGSGKGNAMEQGVKNTRAEIIAFFDADLIGLKKEHISLLVAPILKGEAEMCVGVRERYKGLPHLFIKIDSLLAIGGERAIKRYIFENIPKKFIQGFAVETTINYYCREKKIKVAYQKLKDLDNVIKEKKWGLWKGFSGRLKEGWEIFKIRILLKLKKKELISLSN